MITNPGALTPVLFRSGQMKDYALQSPEVQREGPPGAEIGL